MGRKAKALEGEVVGPNAYDKVKAVMKKDPDLGIMEACAEAKVEYHQYHYYKPKGKKEKKATRTVVVPRNSKAVVIPKMETFEVPDDQQPRSTGRVIALVGTPADVTQSLRDLLKR
jgi:hypothetical protein